MGSAHYDDEKERKKTREINQNLSKGLNQFEEFNSIVPIVNELLSIHSTEFNSIVKNHFAARKENVRCQFEDEI